MVCGFIFIVGGDIYVLKTENKYLKSKQIEKDTLFNIWCNDHRLRLITDEFNKADTAKQFKVMKILFTK